MASVALENITLGTIKLRDHRLGVSIGVCGDA